MARKGGEVASEERKGDGGSVSDGKKPFATGCIEKTLWTNFT